MNIPSTLKLAEFNDCSGKEEVWNKMKDLGLDRHCIMENPEAEYVSWQNDEATLVFWISKNTKQDVVANIGKLAVDTSADEFEHGMLHGVRYFRLWWD